MHTIRLCLGLVSIVALSACVPTVWDRPGATQAEFNMDSAQCQLYAEGAVPDFDTGTISTGHFKRDLAANAVVGIIGGIAQGIAVSQKRDLCMQAKGYVAHAPGGQTAVAAASVPAVPTSPAVPVPVSAPQMSAGPVIPATPAAVWPAPAAVCPAGSVDPRWTDPDMGHAPMLICNPGYQYWYVKVI